MPAGAHGGHGHGLQGRIDGRKRARHVVALAVVMVEHHLEVENEPRH